MKRNTHIQPSLATHAHFADKAHGLPTFQLQLDESQMVNSILTHSIRLWPQDTPKATERGNKRIKLSWYYHLAKSGIHHTFEMELKNCNTPPPPSLQQFFPPKESQFHAVEICVFADNSHAILIDVTLVWKLSNAITDTVQAWQFLYLWDLGLGCTPRRCCRWGRCHQGRHWRCCTCAGQCWTSWYSDP